MSTLSPWTSRHPFAEFDAIVRRAFAAPSRPSGFGFVPAAELTRDGDDALITLELPGLDVGKDVTVEVQDDRLVVHGERKDERGSTGEHGVQWREVRYGSFRRSFRLPAGVTADAIEASYDAGVLSVRVRGAYAGSPAQRIPVTTSAAATEVESAGPAPSES